MKSIIKVLKIWLKIVKMSFARLSVYRLSFLLHLLGSLIWLVRQVVFFEALFLQIDLFAGYSKADMYLLLGINQLVYLIYTMVIVAKRNLGSLIRNFDLDNYLLKPVNSMLFVTLDRVRLEEIFMITGVIGNFAAAFAIEDYSINFWRIFLFLILFVLSLVNLYLVSLIFRLVAFWVVNSDFNYFLDQNWTMMRMPRDFLRNRLLSFIFTAVIPLLLLMNVPFQALAGGLEGEFITVLSANSIVLYFLSDFMWKQGVKNYCDVD
jgi:ABC-2 type transport system permease protein